MSPLSQQARPGFLYEVSWEVCSPGGGVHTVLATSAPFMASRYAGDLLYVGHDKWAERDALTAFVRDPVQPPLAGLAAERDIPVQFGRWDIEGRPPVALVDFGRLIEHKNRILGDLWSDYAVDSIHADWDTVERILFGYAAGMLTELHYHATVRPRAVRAVAHFHQWLSAAGLLRLAKTAPEIATVYTPHGTALGRGLAAAGVWSQAQLATIDPVQAARDHDLVTPHTLEAAAAARASILTCVSEQSVAEATHLLGRRPDLVTQNGYTRPAPRDAGHRAEVRAAILRTAERFVGAPLEPDTRIVFTAGRYEFRNKGLEVAVRALGRLRKRKELPRKLLFLIFAPANQTGRRPEVVQRLKASELAGEPCGICTHNLAHPDDDPILLACREEQLRNAPGDQVHVIFVPVLLDGRDPLFPYSYTDVLEASDLTVFPSLYEPWGYTPLESLAAGIPTVTTELTGFGRFVLGLPEGERKAVAVLPGGPGDTALVDALEAELASFVARSDDELAALGQAGSSIVAHATWDQVIGRTFEAHQEAHERALPRARGAVSPGLAPLSRRALVGIPARSAERPHLHTFTVTAALPERIERLTDLAHNFWWAWTPSARALFEHLGGADNPVRRLRTIDPGELDRLARDEEFLARYDGVCAEFDAYRGRHVQEIPPVAYFCAEFALHASLRIYSGGLGVLAGDHLKSASDLRLPLTGIGLGYARGYFVQRLTADGRQGSEFPTIDPRDTPAEEVLDADGNPLRISLQLPERELKARVWRVDVGTVPLYLLDTLIPENDPADQTVTERLYPSDREWRIRQEILLGMGGWRVLRALGKVPAVSHLNEGHSAFLLLERLLDLVEEQGLTYAEAETAVRSSTLFTTHTPVPAGHDRFSEGLMRRYFSHVAQRLGLDWEEFFDLGRSSREEHEFSMTVLALKLSHRANGVSRLHGEVSRKMLANVWPWVHEAESPVDSITNGVHLATWAGPEVGPLLDEHVSAQWRYAAPTQEAWAHAENIPDQALWTAHQAQKRRLMDFMRDSIEETGLRRGENPTALRRRIEGLDPDALWIGYARRFAPYKRATMLFQDPERIERLLDDPDRPVRVVFAGKAHPDDAAGAALVQEIVRLTADPRFEGRVFFIEDYGMREGALLTQGTDVWLNTPTRPLEASGTSGMKACLNGGLHVSILDGWWCEGHNGGNGWAFGEGREYDNPEMQREHDSRSLYGVLEDEVVPLYFDRDGAGLPRGWIERMKHTIATIPGMFNTHRMVADYAEFGYIPLGESARALAADGYEGARARASRYARLRDQWSQIRIEDVSVTDLSRGSIGIGDVFEVRARVHLGGMAPEDAVVELYVGPVTTAGELEDPVVIPLLRDGEVVDGVAEFTGAYLPRGAGTFSYGVRVYPAVDDFGEAAHLGLMRWA